MSEREVTEPRLGGRFEDALGFAHSIFRGQVRKGGSVPSIAHALGVASIVLEDGGDEDEAIAALLHDAVENVGAIPVLNEIRRRYGDRVARLVEECTDHDPAQDRPEWHVRKRAYVEAIAERPESSRVSLADKLYNARDILVAHRRIGERVWSRYSAGREVLGYLRALADAYNEHAKGPLAAELEATVSELERRSADATAPG